jgi:hypothetical protein
MGGDMPWFIIQSERKTSTVYIVEAEDAETATIGKKESEYLGYFDSETTGVQVNGPFKNADDALESDFAFVDGR